ncbi:hypothetical protein PPL_00877 [Heterostelium album PN500]|uniref:Ankyrin repeat protein n=1 Tax=Heterostelium pallidum (strain ATCC 26659 / Pp 5 / PN500) TaxID=670386 RepID=D3AYV8_HETP5|nr:hypothetical protein PPL_00877 [Heterostelium album PN500]EFA85648.1 hypothetical protein PPL_00877 [Heterostelium album PN500]|eukprot:XP_020437755.1 hypothetical protein PPL_00877 [Heterostelium album PN500]
MLFLKIFRIKIIQRLIFNKIKEIHKSLETEGISWKNLYRHPRILVWPSAIFDGNYELAEFIYNYLNSRPINFSVHLRDRYFATFEEVVKQKRIDLIKIMDRDYKLSAPWYGIEKYASQTSELIRTVAKHGFVEGIDYFLTKYSYEDIPFNVLLQRAVATKHREMVRCLLDHGKPKHAYGRDIIRCNDIEIYKLLYLHRSREFKAEILHNILTRISLHFIEFMYENRSDKSVDPFQFYRANLFYILIKQDSFDKLQFFIKVRESVCYYTLIITAVRFERSEMLRFIITSRNNENRKRYRNIKTAERLRNRAISSLQQYGRCDTLVEEITNDILNVKLS